MHRRRLRLWLFLLTQRPNVLGSPQADGRAASLASLQRQLVAPAPSALLFATPVQQSTVTIAHLEVRFP